MIIQILNEIKNSTEPLQLSYLSQKFCIEKSALEGMLTYSIHKGKLRDDDEFHSCDSNGKGSCGSHCAGTDNCSFVAKMPKTYFISHKSKPK